MKALILGTNGMAGHIISLYLTEAGHETSGVSRSKNDFTNNNYVCDVSDWVKLKKIIQNDNYDVIINCIGVLNNFCDENIENSIYINSLLPHKISNLIKDTDTKLIHLSTDCVFLGDVGSYTENSNPNSTSLYGKTKALGEIIDDKNVTIRTSIIGPDLNFDGIGLFNWFMKQRVSINGYRNVIWNGITTLSLAKGIEKLMNKEYHGIYHFVNENPITKYELCKIFNRVFKNNNIEIIPFDDITSNKTLINTLSIELKIIVPDYNEMITEMKKWILDHKNLYNYNI